MKHAAALVQCWPCIAFAFLAWMYPAPALLKSVKRLWLCAETEWLMRLEHARAFCISCGAAGLSN